MADEDEQVENIGDNDEYQFADLDGLGTESLDPVLEEDDAAIEAAGEGVSSPPGRGRLDPQMMKIIKKGVLAVGGLILFLFIYKLITSFFAVPPEAAHKNIPVAAKKALRVESITPKAPMPVQASNEALNYTDKKVNALEQERGRLNADLLTMHQQIRDVTQTVSNMTASLDEIKQSMEQISEKMDQQSQQMVRLQSINRAKRIASTQKSKKVTPKVEQTRYFIQAVIPGRAWLMSTKGTMLTVSRGSEVPGYGDVRLINPKLGRIFTSSGRIIKFSQADS
jgi:intracellular multiplication protein IcmG